jgi:hypothetical protein
MDYFSSRSGRQITKKRSSVHYGTLNSVASNYYFPHRVAQLFIASFTVNHAVVVETLSRGFESHPFRSPRVTPARGKSITIIHNKCTEIRHCPLMCMAGETRLA